jgi:hypothetical protein
MPKELKVKAIHRYLKSIKINREKSYEEFLKNSPGKNIDAAEIQFGIGHGYPPKEQS